MPELPKEELFDLVTKFSDCVSSLPEEKKNSKEIAANQARFLGAFATGDTQGMGRELFDFGIELLDEQHIRKENGSQELIQFAYDCIEVGYNNIPDEDTCALDCYQYAGALIDQNKFAPALDELDEFYAKTDLLRDERDYDSSAKAMMAVCWNNLDRPDAAKDCAIQSILADVELYLKTTDTLPGQFTAAIALASKHSQAFTHSIKRDSAMNVLLQVKKTEAENRTTSSAPQLKR